LFLDHIDRESPRRAGEPRPRPSILAHRVGGTPSRSHPASRSASCGDSIPDWMRDIGVDIRVVGLFTLAQAPWAFKVLWSPLMDRTCRVLGPAPRLEWR